jgi:hypothetical protein
MCYQTCKKKLLINSGGFFYFICILTIFGGAVWESNPPATRRFNIQPTRGTIRKYLGFSFNDLVKDLVKAFEDGNWILEVSFTI